jgi:hypothetical protein
MAIISENPIKNYEMGMPCMFGETVGRIVGESDKGSWGIINDIEMHSIPLFATPHGTIIKTGVLHLSEMTDEGMERLMEYEMDALKKNGHGNLYAGKLDD